MIFLISVNRFILVNFYIFRYKILVYIDEFNFDKWDLVDCFILLDVENYIRFSFLYWV